LVAEATSLRKDPYPVPPPPTAVVKVTPAAYPDAKVKEVSPAPATAGPAGNPTEAKLAVPLSDSSVAHAVYSAPLYGISPSSERSEAAVCVINT
jgi:hypothetical protein